MYIEKLKIFSTSFTENLAYNLKKILEPSICCKVFIRKLNKSDIVNLDNHEFLFIFSPHNLISVDISYELPYNKYFLYQTEQLNTEERKEKYFNSPKNISKRVFFWSENIFDYSKNNINLFKEKSSTYLPFAIENLDKKDYNKIYDISFFGKLNERREIILDTLQKLYPHLNIQHFENYYGNSITNIIKKSKIVLNLHYFDNSTLEVARLSEIIPYNTHIISESTNEKSLLEKFDFIYFIDEIEITSDKNGNIVFTMSKLLQIKNHIDNLLSSLEYNHEKKKI